MMQCPHLWVHIYASQLPVTVIKGLFWCKNSEVSSHGHSSYCFQTYTKDMYQDGRPWQRRNLHIVEARKQNERKKDQVSICPSRACCLWPPIGSITSDRTCLIFAQIPNSAYRIDGKKARNSNQVGILRQELTQRPWRSAASGIAPHGLLIPAFL